MVWYDKQTEWEEENDYETIGASSKECTVDRKSVV